MDVATVRQPAGLAIRGRSKWPNMIVFPMELRNAIPVYGSRALVFDSVSGSHGGSPIAVAGMLGEELVDFGTRTRTELLVHETGKLKGIYVTARFRLSNHAGVG